MLHLGSGTYEVCCESRQASEPTLTKNSLGLSREGRFGDPLEPLSRREDP